MSSGYILESDDVVGCGRVVVPGDVVEHEAEDRVCEEGFGEEGRVDWVIGCGGGYGCRWVGWFCKCHFGGSCVVVVLVVNEIEEGVWLYGTINPGWRDV